MGTRVLIPHTNTRVYEYNSDGSPRRVSDTIQQWLHDNCPQGQYRRSDYSNGEYRGEVWEFGDANMAMMFKLAWGGV